MLDRIIAGALRRLIEAKDQVGTKRDGLWRERAGDTYRLSARTAQTHPEGYTTTPPKNYAAAQQEYAAVRREWDERGAELFGLVTALMVARERRDEAKAEHERWLRKESERKEGPHPEIKGFFARMFAHKVRPEQLIEVRPETLAIICDIIRWDGHDPEWKDGASPMPEVFRIYADRVIAMPGQMTATARSKIGGGVSDETTIHYSFDRVLAAQVGEDEGCADRHGSAGDAEARGDDVQPAIPQHGALIDCSVYPNEELAVLAENSASEIEPNEDAHLRTSQTSVWRCATEKFDSDPNAMSDLEREIILCGRNPTWQQIVRRLTACAGPSQQGDFGVFITAVKRSGDISVGLAAYRHEAIGRLASQMKGETLNGHAAGQVEQRRVS